MSFSCLFASGYLFIITLHSLQKYIFSWNYPKNFAKFPKKVTNSKKSTTNSGKIGNRKTKKGTRKDKKDRKNKKNKKDRSSRKIHSRPRCPSRPSPRSRSQFCDRPIRRLTLDVRRLYHTIASTAMPKVRGRR